MSHDLYFRLVYQTQTSSNLFALVVSDGRWSYHDRDAPLLSYQPASQSCQPVSLPVSPPFDGRESVRLLGMGMGCCPTHPITSPSAGLQPPDPKAAVGRGEAGRGCGESVVDSSRGEMRPPIREPSNGYCWHQKRNNERRAARFGSRLMLMVGGPDTCS